MADKDKTDTDIDQSFIYQIRMKGHLEDQWSDWFEGMEIILEENGETVLTGPVVDQPALHGILKKVRDLGIPLISINRVGPDQVECSRQDIDAVIDSEE